jgi:hypothetical protein
MLERAMVGVRVPAMTADFRIEDATVLPPSPASRVRICTPSRRTSVL